MSPKSVSALIHPSDATAAADRSSSSFAIVTAARAAMWGRSSAKWAEMARFRTGMAATGPPSHFTASAHRSISAALSC